MDNLRQRGLLKDNLRDNIESLIELRDNSIHFINPDSISKQVQELGFACIKNYMSIIKEWTIKIDLSSYNFYLMPLYNRKNEMCRVGKRNAMVLVENEM